MKKKENLVSIYATVSQLAFSIITPLLIFIVGGSWLSNKYGWPDWAMGICVGLGILFMLAGGGSYLAQLIKIYGKDNNSAPKSYNPPRDNDYYDDYKDLRK